MRIDARTSRTTPAGRPALAAAFLASAMLLAGAAGPAAAQVWEAQPEAGSEAMGAPAPAGPGPAAEAFPSGPFGKTIWIGFAGSTSFVEIPHSAALNPTAGFTFEAWVHEVDYPAGFEACKSIAGKGYLTAWWVGLCTVGGQRTLRSYTRGGSSAFNSGVVTSGSWHHVAVTWDGSKLRHYVDGALTGERTQGSPTTNSAAVRIGSDVNWNFPPNARIDEVRLWNRARNHAEIYQGMRYAIRAPEDGLVAVWSFDDTSSTPAFLRDEIGSHDGAASGLLFFHDTLAPVVVAPEPPDTAWLTTGELPGFEFQVRITSGGTERLGTKVADCVPETLCVAGAIPTRSEIFLRIIGPRPNGFLWAQSARFTVSQVEVWIRESATGQINYYDLAPVDADSDENFGFNDRNAFLP